jgi:HEAT repeat protein
MRRTGIELHGLDKINEEVSVQLAGVPLKDALENLLAHANYILSDAPAANGRTRLHVLILGEQGRPGTISATAARLKQPVAAHDETSAEAAAHRANIEEVRKALDDSDPVVRSAALAALSQEDPQAVAEVMASLPENRKASMSRLQELQRVAQDTHADGQSVVVALGDALKDSDPAVQAFAVQSLADRTDPQALEYLRNAYQGLDPANRMLAVETAVQNEGSQQILQDAMRDPDKNIRAAAAEILKQFGQSNGGNNPDTK